MVGNLVDAINQICLDRGIDPEVVFKALQDALAEAYKREHPEAKVTVELNKQTGEIHLFLIKKVVKKVKNKDTEINLSEAKKYAPNIKVGDNLEIEIPIGSMGRIAAQIAKHVINKKIRDAELKAFVDFYADRLGKIVSGTIQRVRKDKIFVELEKGTAEFPREEQTPNEFYEIGKRYKFLVKEIINEEYNRHVILSRKDPNFIKALFELEIPEIANEQVEIKAIAREPGVRSKVAVAANDSTIDPVGTCIGPKGSRIGAIMDELGEEKVEIVAWDLDVEKFIANAMAPATVEKVEYDADSNAAKVYVKSDQVPVALGKDGTNVKLVKQLIGLDDIEVVEVKEKEQKKAAKSSK